MSRHAHLFDQGTSLDRPFPGLIEISVRLDDRGEQMILTTLPHDQHRFGPQVEVRVVGACTP